MSLLYVNENSAQIGIEANRCFVKYADGIRGIPVSYYSKGGSYFGRLHSTGHVNAKRQRMQSALY